MGLQPAEVDVLVAGSGAAEMTAALTAAHLGPSVLVIEKAGLFGGSTARSGGGIWAPGNTVLRHAGVTDAPLAAPPFYAVKIVPGDLGTKGGLRTDECARVLRADGTLIEGLYAAANASASVMGHSYAGAGATIGPAMTFGYIAARTMAAVR